MAEITEEFRTENGRRVAILRVSGKLTLGAGEMQLQVAIQDAHAQGWNAVLDMAKLTIIDSTGIAQLVAAYRAFARLHQGLAILKLPIEKRRLFRITDIEKLFSFYEDEEQAVASFDAPVRA